MTDDIFGQFLDDRLAPLGHGPVLSFTRTLHRRRSSFRLEAVDAHLADGTHLSLVCKTTGRSGLAPPTRTVKPSWRHDPGREPWCYEHLLEPLNGGTARWYGTDSAHRWLLLECAHGHPLTEDGDPRRWDDAVTWLARFHAAAPVPIDSPLLHFDAAGAERSWISALSHAAWGRVGPMAAARAALERSVEILADEPNVVVHGEWFPSNVVVDPRSERVCPVDWELAGIGPAVLDLATFTTGWPPERAAEMVEIYRRAAGTADSGAEGLRTSWAAARVVVAVHRLADECGRTPLERRHDWWDELASAVADLNEDKRCAIP